MLMNYRMSNCLKCHIKLKFFYFLKKDVYLKLIKNTTVKCDKFILMNKYQQNKFSFSLVKHVLA